ncbi:MAG: dethiobiotin synthetase [Planctomycetota bacterium]|jgi:dethiobiotin synthetase
MISADHNGYFITGSDTDVGKTYIACEIVRQLRGLDFSIEIRKPAESGCRLDADGTLITHDARALREANGNSESIEQITPHRFQAVLAPHRAARLEQKELWLADLLKACQKLNSDSCLLVEGAGGFYSPLAEDALNADLACALQLPVVIVVCDRIGAVNQALLTIAAVASNGLTVAAIILNEVEAPTNTDMDNYADLQAHCQLPLFRCPHQGRLENLFERADV